MLIALVLLVAQAQDFSKVEIKTTKVAGNVYILQGSGGNIAVTAGEDGVAMVDDQFAPLAPKIHAAIATISPKPVKFLINTHWHGDHVGGNLQFADTATIFAHENVRTRMQKGATIMAGGQKHEMPASPAGALPVVTFKDGVSLWWNGEEIKAIHLRPGHTDGDTVIYFSKSNVLHMGDDFVTYGFPFVDQSSGGSVLGLVEALDVILGQVPADAKVIPGHGDVSTVADVKKFRSALEEMVGVVKKGLAAGKSVEQLQKEKVLAAWEPTWGKGFVKADMFIGQIAGELSAKPAGAAAR
jgi:glyoxylase-like metal-dependent hydrolase (beta-lactamase superfamily II)